MDSTGTLFMPPASSTIASDVDALFYFILYAAIFFMVVVVGLFTYFAIKYRRRGEATLTSGVAHNTTLEIVWTAVPTFLLAIVFVWSFKSYMKLWIVPKDAIEIKVTGQKWFWSFDYEDGANTVNELVVPVSRPIKLLMSSRDVIHSFFVPSFRVKMDVLPNRYSITWFEATREGVYQLFCTEYCGKGHSEMIGKVKVVSKEEYITWIDASSNLGEGMTLEEYGAVLYNKKGCVTCHSIDGSANNGPSFLNKFGTMESLTDGGSVLIDENYLRESILEPQRKVVLGYAPTMPTFQRILKARQIDALVAFIKSLSEKNESSENE